MHQTRNSLVRLVAVNAGIGVVVGLTCAGALLATDYRGIWSLLWKTDAEIPAFALLFGGFAVTFGSVVCGSAIMALGDGVGGDQGPNHAVGRMSWRQSLVRECAARTSRRPGVWR